MKFSLLMVKDLLYTLKTAIQAGVGLGFEGENDSCRGLQNSSELRYLTLRQ